VVGAVDPIDYPGPLRENRAESSCASDTNQSPDLLRTFSLPVTSGHSDPTVDVGTLALTRAPTRPQPQALLSVGFIGELERQLESLGPETPPYEASQSGARGVGLDAARRGSTGPDMIPRSPQEDERAISEEPTSVRQEHSIDQR